MMMLPDENVQDYIDLGNAMLAQHQPAIIIEEPERV